MRIGFTSSLGDIYKWSKYEEALIRLANHKNENEKGYREPCVYRSVDIERIESAHLDTSRNAIRKMVPDSIASFIELGIDEPNGDYFTVQVKGYRDPGYLSAIYYGAIILPVPSSILPKFDNFFDNDVEDEDIEDVLTFINNTMDAIWKGVKNAASNYRMIDGVEVDPRVVANEAFRWTAIIPHMWEDNHKPVEGEYFNWTDVVEKTFHNLAYQYLEHQREEAQKG